MTNETTTFKQLIREALENAPDADSLAQLVRGFYAAGGSKSDAYETLQEIWLEAGYDEDGHAYADPKRDAIEFIMERVWYGGA